MGLEAAFVPVAITDRSGFDESVHYGAVVVVDADGDVLFSAGDVDVLIYPRSANKPMQTDAMLRLGVELTPQEIALASSSHSGTPRHVAVVAGLLRRFGLTPAALGNTHDLPIDRDAAEAYLAAGGTRDAIHMNCSGKHAAMVSTCLHHGWDVDGYLAFDHPLQVALTAHIADLAGGVAHIGVDGCGAPAHVTSLIGLAQAFRRLATGRGAVWSAMTEHPTLAGGVASAPSRMMVEVPGLIAKDGAEGVFAAAFPGGPSVAVKISDGALRASTAVTAAALAVAEVAIDPGSFSEAIRGHGQPVGRVRALLGNA
jgi:L-asparaginase II